MPMTEIRPPPASKPESVRRQCTFQGPAFLLSGDYGIVANSTTVARTMNKLANGKEVVRALLPKLKATAIWAKLAPIAPDGSAQWMTAAFWVKQVDLFLLEAFITAVTFCSVC